MSEPIEYSAERSGITWIATPPDNTRSDYGRYFYTDPQTGVHLKENMYPRGMVTEWHRHTHAHGMFILAGKLYTNHGIYEPGTFLWWPAGTIAEHGATPDADARVFFMTAGSFDLLYEPAGPNAEKEAAGLTEYVRDSRAMDWEEIPAGTQNPGNAAYCEKKLLNDSLTGEVVALRRYPAGWQTDWHSAACSCGFYVLEGVMKTDRGFYGPGSFVWFPQGAVSLLAASQYTDATVIFVADKPERYQPQAPRTVTNEKYELG